MNQEDNTPEEVIKGDGSEREGIQLRPKALQESPSPVLGQLDPAKVSDGDDEQNLSLYKDSDRNSPSPKRSPGPKSPTMPTQEIEMRSSRIRSEETKREL